MKKIMYLIGFLLSSQIAYVADDNSACQVLFQSIQNGDDLSFNNDPLFYIKGRQIIGYYGLARAKEVLVAGYPFERLYSHASHHDSFEVVKESMYKWIMLNKRSQETEVDQSCFETKGQNALSKRDIYCLKKQHSIPGLSFQASCIINNALIRSGYCAQGLLKDQIRDEIIDWVKSHNEQDVKECLTLFSGPIPLSVYLLFIIDFKFPVKKIMEILSKDKSPLSKKKDSKNKGIQVQVSLKLLRDDAIANNFNEYLDSIPDIVSPLPGTPRSKFDSATTSGIESLATGCLATPEKTGTVSVKGRSAAEMFLDRSDSSDED